MRDRRARHTIQTRLFAAYSILIVITLVAFGTIFWVYASDVLEHRATAALETLSTTLLERIDQEIRTMDAISLSVAYAELERPEAQQGSNGDGRATEPLPQLLGSVLELFLAAPELYLHEVGGRTVAAGLYTGSVRDAIPPNPCVEEAVKENGRLYLSLPHSDPNIDREIPIYRGRRFVSLCRVYFDPFGKALGVVEVEQGVGTLFGDLTSTEIRGAGTDVVVYSANGAVTYSTAELPKRALSTYFGALTGGIADGRAPSGGALRTNVRGGPRVLAYARSAYSGLTVMAIEPESYVFAPVYTFTRILVTGGLIAILLTLLLSFLVARRLTTPIKTLHDAILQLDGERLFSSPPEKLETNLDELEELNAAFERMHIKLRDSVQDLITLRSHEELTRMISLQSQMKPHFLYNTLANISAMAEESMNDRIVQLCGNLSAMYRYLADGFSNLVTLKEELDFTRRYLACMSYRFEDTVDCSCSVPRELEELQIPKLTVQPLVENVLKYGVIPGRRIEIRVGASTGGGRWTLTVEDNGPAFSQEALEAVGAQLGSIDKNGDFEHFPTDGVGIPNIYGRLRILYGPAASIRIGRSGAGGASVSIGGSVSARFGA